METEGLVLINTGPGKGKTTAALGVAVRALGHGRRVAFLQFIKQSATGESRFLEEYAGEHPDQLYYARLGLGFVGKEPSAADLAKAAEGMAEAEKRRQWADLLVLDEVNVALDKGLVPLEWAVGFIRGRPRGQDLVLTGRGCPRELYDLAQTVTEMAEVKHAFRQGHKARKGLDF
jgi:cob(I)alamin adenosyltransferase